MKIVYRKDTLFVRQFILDEEGAATYTRDPNTYPDATHDDALIADNPTAVTNFRAGKAFKVDVHPSPTTVNQITRSQLEYISPTDDAGSSWASGIDGIVFTDDSGAEIYKQDFRIQGIHSSATTVDVIFDSNELGIIFTVTCTRGNDTDEYTWNSGDNFLYTHNSFKTLGLVGSWGINAQNIDGEDYHFPVDGTTEGDETTDDFIVVPKQTSTWKEFVFVEVPNDVVVTFNFPAQEINFAVTAGSPGDVFSVKVNGNGASYTQQGGDVAADIVDGLKIAIDALSQPVTVTDNGNDFDITADDIALRFTYSSSTTGGSIAETVTDEGGGASEGTPIVFMNGVYVKQADYTEVQDAVNENIIEAITFGTAPATGDEVLVRAILAITREYDQRINQRRFCNPR